MKPRTVLILVTLVVIALVAVVILLTGGKPQLSISRSDVVTGAVVTEVNRAKLPDTNITVAIWLRLDGIATAKFVWNSWDHPNQKVHIVAGTNVVAEVSVYSEIQNRGLDLFLLTTMKQG